MNENTVSRGESIETNSIFTVRAQHLICHFSPAEKKKKKVKKEEKKKRQHFEELNFGGKEKVSCISGLDMHLITDAQVRSITANRFLSLPLPQSQMNVPDFGAVQKSHMFCFVF